MAADRLATLMAYSGAVIILQETDSLYHFSGRLKPWVHYGAYLYVGTSSDSPIAYSTLFHVLYSIYHHHLM
jgi:hypothetical protein